jgi:predicted small secreted protein
MRLIAFAVIAAISLTSCATYEGASITGEWKDVTRADIAAAVQVSRAQRHVQPASNKLEEIEVIGHDEIDLFWTFGEEDIVKRIHGQWQYVGGYVVVGRQKI